MDVKEDYLKINGMLQARGGKSTNSTDGTISRYFGPVMNKNQLRELEDQLKFALGANISFNFVADCEKERLLLKWNPSSKIIGRTVLSTTLLNLLPSTQCQEVANTYEEAYVSLCINECLTPERKK